MRRLRNTQMYASEFLRGSDVSGTVHYVVRLLSHSALYQAIR